MSEQFNSASYGSGFVGGATIAATSRQAVALLEAAKIAAALAMPPRDRDPVAVLALALQAVVNEASGRHTHGQLIEALVAASAAVVAQTSDPAGILAHFLTRASIVTAHLVEAAQPKGSA